MLPFEINLIVELQEVQELNFISNEVLEINE